MPPARTAPCTQCLPVKCDGDLSQRAALAAQSEDLGQRRLLGWLWLNMLAIRREPIPVSDVPHTPPGGLLCCIASRVRSPIASRSHWLTAVMMLITQPARSRAGIERLRDRDERNSAPLESFEQFGQVFNATREPVEFGDDDGVYFSFVHQREQTLHARSLQVLGGLAAVHN